MCRDPARRLDIGRQDDHVVVQIFRNLEGFELRMEASEHEEFCQLLPLVGDFRSMTRPGSNALFSILPLQFT